MKKRIGTLLMIVVMAVSLTVVSPYKAFAAGTLIIEGENSFKTSITCSTQSANSLSGGKALVVRRTADNIPKDGCTLLYKLQAQYEGAYYMYITCPTIGAAWISPCEIKINDGKYEKLTSMKYEQVGTLNGTGVADNLYNEYKLQSVELKKGINNIYVRIPSARQSDGQMYFYLDCMKFVPAPWGINGFDTGAPVNVYEEKDEIKPAIKFSFSDSSPHRLYYRVADYFDNTVVEETVDVKDISKYEIDFKKKLNIGHYTVHVSGDDEPEKEYYFSVVKNFEDRDFESNTHFMVDAAGIYLIDPDKIEAYARSMRLAGITSVRERFRWTVYQKASDDIDMSLFETYQKAYSENGMHTMALNESAPAFMKTDSHAFPKDLVEAYKFAKYMTERYGSAVDVEAWNEPDAKDEPADYLAAYVKAMAIGQKDGSADNKAIGPGLCVSPSLYADTFLQNEVMDYLDVWSFHSHITSANSERKYYDIPGIVDLFMDTIKRYGHGDDKYYYLTEAGISLLPNPDVRVDRQRIQARYCATSMLQSAAMGIDRHYWFVYPYYKEGDLWWGSFTQDDMPQSVYNTLAAVTDAVGEAKYVGELNVGEGVNCLVFENKGNHVAAFWSENDTQISINTKQPQAELTDIMGVSRSVASQNGGFILTSGPDVQYLKVDGKLDELYDAAYNEKNVETTDFSKAQRVILQQNYPAECVPGSKNGGYILSGDDTTSITLDVTNLNDTAVTAAVTGKAFGGWQMMPAVQSVTVEPYSKKSLTFEIKAGEEVLAGVSAPVVFEATVGGERTTRSVTTIITPVDENVQTSYYLNGYDDPANWTKNMTDGGREERTTDGKGTLNIRYVFESGDKWVYPKFKLQGDNLGGTAGLVYEAYFDEVPEGLTLRAFAYENNGSVYFTDAGIKSARLKKGWNRIVIPWAEFIWQGGLTDFNFNLDPDELNAVSLGLNSYDVKDITYKIRNVGVYSQPDANIFASFEDAGIIVSGSEVSVSVAVSENQTGIQPDSIMVTIDGQEIEAEYNNNVITARTAVKPGEHELQISFIDSIGKAIFTTKNFRAE